MSERKGTPPSKHNRPKKPAGTLEGTPFRPSQIQANPSGDTSEGIIELLPEMRRPSSAVAPHTPAIPSQVEPVHARAIQKLYLKKIPAHVASLESLWSEVRQQEKATTKDLLRLYQKMLLLKGLGLSCHLSEFHHIAKDCLAQLNQLFQVHPTQQTARAEHFTQKLKQLAEVSEAVTQQKILSLPSAPAVSEQATNLSDSVDPAPALSNKGTVLVVDDDKDQRNLIQFTLGTQNIHSLLATSGAEALQIVRSTIPDIVLLDINMPGMDGFDTLRALRTTPGMETIPVLFLTGNRDESKILKAYNAGIDDYLQKPFTPSIFLAKLKQILQKQLQQRLLLQGEFQPGLILNQRYEIITEFARGGMGIVYLIRHLPTDQILALKSISVQQSRRSHQLQRFQREARFLFQIHHPSLIRILDAGIYQGVPYYVMRLMPGGTLLDHLEQGAFPPQVALAITIQMAEALHDAHQKGVLHRDLKSTNILFDERGRPILTDFGSAMTLGDASPRLTHSGHVIGTPCYMSPEQLRSPQDVDHRSDIFSLGFVLYEMLVGQHPFAELSPTDVMARIVTERIPPLQSLNPSIPPSIVALCNKAMHHHMNQRFGTAKEFAEACRQELHLLPREVILAKHE